IAGRIAHRRRTGLLPDAEQLENRRLMSITVTGPTIVATEGASIFGTIGSFTDTNTSRSSSDYQGRIDWGDGSGPDPSLIVYSQDDGNGDPVPGEFEFTGSHIYHEAGQYTLKVTLTVPGDPNEPGGSGSITASISDASLTLFPVKATSQAGVPFSDV